jgi:hypothetical protein
VSTGGDEPLVIKVKLDVSDAMARQAAVGAGFDKTTARADAAAKKVAAAHQKATDAQFVSLGKVQAAGIKLQDKLAAAAKKAADAQKKAADEAAERWNVAGKAGDNFVNSLRSIAVQAVSLQAVEAAFRAITRALAESNKQLDDYADDLFKVKDQLKELATLKGLATASDDFIKQIATFSRATGLSISQTDEFQRQFLGSIAGGQQKGNIDQATAERLMVEGGKVAARQTKDVLTRGDLLGILSQFRKYDQGDAGVKQALSDAEAIRIGLTEGRGDDAPLTKSLLHVAGSFVGDKGPLPSLPEMAALLGVMSLSAGPGEADTRTEQLIRGLRGTTPDQIAWLRDHGIGETDTAEVKLDKLVPQLRAEQAAGRDIGTFLTEAKFSDEFGRAMGEVLPNYEVLKKRFAAARQAPSGADIMAESERQAALDHTQRRRMADADLAAARLARGAEREPIRPDVIAAQAQLIAEGQDTGLLGLLLQGAAGAGSAFTKPGLEAMAEQRALEDLSAKTGVSAPEEPGSGFLGFLRKTVMEGLFGTTLGPEVGKSFESGLGTLTGANVEALKFQRQQLDAQLRTAKAMERVADVVTAKPPATAKPPVGPLAPWNPGPAIRR